MSDCGEPPEVIWRKVATLHEWRLGIDITAGLQNSVYFFDDAIRINDMLENALRHDRIAAVVVEWDVVCIDYNPGARR